MVKMKVTLKCTFSGAKEIKEKDVTAERYKEWLGQIGKVFNHFDGKQQVHYNYKIIKVEKVKQ